MGAWDVIKELGSAVLSGISYANSTLKAYENDYDYYSDEELLDEAQIMIARYNRSSSVGSDRVEYGNRIQAIINVLNSRGYDI